MALLAIDVGNTQTAFGLFEGAELREHWRIATERNRSGDVTVEELRGENDDPKLTADALAERLGERARTDDDTP